MSPSDYFLITTALTFPAESTTMQCINITIIEDSIYEENQVFVLSIDVTTLDAREGNTLTIVTITEGTVALP